ncbi:15515_t:CDS:2 [Funneliformis geosporum]|uniref:7330_t:CDS:1 n=1 Tax=Funneliformis geosporum TaxID=1117311 RepID=A0A9W4WTW6_9GLOM|nr:15515_t:CDS:2 [Funneliformis geosporum]CAI2163263.1 7330_t:CDS:2 [Funneliformis geosporum]
MGRKQKTTNNVLNTIPIPTEKQKIARVLNGRGKNLFEIQFSDGNTTLCILPPKFRNLIWVKRETTERVSKVGGEIEHVLFSDHIKHLKYQEIWPRGFESQEEENSRHETDSEELFVNTNRHEIDDDTTTSSENEED